MAEPKDDFIAKVRQNLKDYDAAVAVPTTPDQHAGAVFHSTPDNAFVRADGTPVILRGFNIHGVWTGSDGRWTGSWDQTTLNKVKAAGFNSLRVGLKWDRIETSRGQFNSDYLNTLDSVIDKATTAGLYVYLNCVHLYNKGGWPGWAFSGADGVDTIVANGKGYTQMLARRYRDNPTVIGYDINEPDKDKQPDAVLRMYDAWIGWIREIDADKICFIESAWGNSDPSAGNPAILTNKRNVVYSSHCYYSGAGQYHYDGWKGYNGDKADLERWIDTRLAWCAKAGIPLEFGECGIGTAATNRDKWCADFAEICNRKKLSSQWWEWYTSNGTRLSATDTSRNVYPWVLKLKVPA